MFKELEITGSGVGLFFMISIIVTVGIIVFFRMKYQSYNPQRLKELNSDIKTKSLAETTKYPEVDVFKISSSLFNYGLLFSVAMCLIAMNWTSYEKKIKVNLNDINITDEVEIKVPRTTEPTPPPVIQEVPNTEIITEDQPVFENQEVTMDTKIDAPVVIEKKVSTPPPPPPSPVEEEIFKVVEKMPRFPGCEDKSTDAEKIVCSRTKLM